MIKFQNRSYDIDVRAPADGRVVETGYGTANGLFVRLEHDLDGNGIYDDKIRSVYLHLSLGSIKVTEGNLVKEGQLLGSGGMTGWTWTPHLHFEVQRAHDSSFADKWSVDPYGWYGNSPDPWPYSNRPLWKYTLHTPAIFR